MDISLLGEGGYGAVYKVSNYAIKMIACATSDATQTFHKECRIGMELSHPNIVR